MEIKRGGIYYIKNTNAIGHEMMKSRPAVIVSCDPLNYTGHVASVVFLTSSQQAKQPYHVSIKAIANARHRISTALCEHVYTVDSSRVGKLLGRCSDAEMDMIDNALLMTMGLGCGKYKGPGTGGKPLARPGEAEQGTVGSTLDLTRAEAERDTYKALYERLLDDLTAGRRAET